MFHKVVWQGVVGYVYYKFSKEYSTEKNSKLVKFDIMAASLWPTSVDHPGFSAIVRTYSFKLSEEIRFLKFQANMLFIHLFSICEHRQ